MIAICIIFEIHVCYHHVSEFASLSHCWISNVGLTPHGGKLDRPFCATAVAASMPNIARKRAILASTLATIAEGGCKEGEHHSKMSTQMPMRESWRKRKQCGRVNHKTFVLVRHCRHRYRRCTGFRRVTFAIGHESCANGYTETTRC